MSREFLLPDLGEGITEAQIIRLLVSEGDTVAEDQALMEVETDKAAVEIPSPFAGVAERVHVEEGQTVNVGEVMVTFADGEGQAESRDASTAARAAPPAPQQAPTPPPRDTEPPVGAPRVPGAKAGPVAAAPAVRKLAREMGVDLASVPGSGPGGRILKEDLEKAARGETPRPAPTPVEVPMAAPARPPAPPPGAAGEDKWGPVRRAPLSQIRKTIANQMVRSTSTIPHVTHFDDADITALDGLRRGYTSPPGEPERKLTLMPFVVRALSFALREFPELNASFDHEAGEIIYKDYVSIGIAVDTERGLVVPVLRDADRRGVLQIADALVILIEKVRRTQFTVDELRGASFTITNVGALGGRYATPIINHPEVAILGVGRSRLEPVVVDEVIEPRLILPLSLSFDHRVTDGAQAARFVRAVIGYLENPVRLML